MALHEPHLNFNRHRNPSIRLYYALPNQETIQQIHISRITQSLIRLANSETRGVSMNLVYTPR